MKVFGLEIADGDIAAMTAHAERDYPVEACGLGFGRATDERVARIVPMRNVQDRYHARDPVAFPRTGRDAFRMDELERMRVLDSGDAKGMVERVVYHSHCDAGAYFSPEDRAMAIHDGVELIPGAIQIVISVRDGKHADMAAFRYDAARGAFDEVRMTPNSEVEAWSSGLPSLTARAMESRGTSTLVRPVAGRLVPRRLSLGEMDSLAWMAEGRCIVVESARAIEDLRRFECGLYSPLAGFMRAAEVRSVESRGRSIDGLPWRDAITLEVSRGRQASAPEPSTVVELVDEEGRRLALIALTEVMDGEAKNSLRLAGPVYVYPRGTGPDAAETRSELLRRGAKRVLAIAPAFAANAANCDLSGFDAVACETLIAAIATLPVCMSDDRPWLAAVMAQNQGATHLWVEDPSLARALEETLDIRAWRP